MKKNFNLIILFLFFSQVLLFSQSISDKMYNLLLSESFSPLTQNLVSSGENDFNYNIIVEFDSKNLNDEKKVSNLIFIFNQEDFFYHDFLNNSLTNLSEENDFQKDNKNQVSNLQMTLNSNRQMILKLLSELRIQNFDFNLFFLFTTGEKQYPEKRDMIFGSQVFLERLNSNEDYTVFFINLNETKTKIITNSKGTTSPSWMIQKTFNIFIKNGFSKFVPSFYLSQLFKLKIFDNKLLTPFFENNIPAIQIDFNLKDFLKQINLSGKHNNKQNETVPILNDFRVSIINQLIEEFAKTPQTQRIWEHHFLMIKMFGNILNLSEKTTVKIIIVIVFLWIFFLLFFIFINHTKKKYDWQQIKKIWFVVPLTFFLILFSFWIGRQFFLFASASFSNNSKLFAMICTQFLLTFILLSAVYEFLLIFNLYFEEHSIDFLITFCCFINQSFFILIDISLFPIFMFICILSILALIIKNNILHISVFVLMAVSFLPYFALIINQADLSLLRQFYFTNNNVLLFFTLILYPIFIVYFRILTSFKRKMKKNSTHIITTVAIVIFVTLFIITSCFVKIKSLQKTNNKKNEYVIKASKEDSIKFTFSDKKIFDDIIRTIKVEFTETPLQVDISIECPNETPILYSDNDFVRTSSNSAHFKIPYMPPKKMTFSYCCSNQPSKLIITAISPSEEQTLLNLISKTIEIDNTYKTEK